MGDPGFHHVGVLVRDMTETIRWFEQALGVMLNPPQRITSVNRIDPGEFGDEELHEGTSYITWSKDGPPYYEIMEAKDAPDGLHSLSKHGPGLHHVGVYVEDVDAEIARLEAFGIGLQGRVVAPDGSTVTCWTEPSAETGLAVEYMHERMRAPMQIWIETGEMPQVSGTTR